MKRITSPFIFLLAVASLGSFSFAEFRTWKTDSGGSLEAEFIAQEGDKIILKLKDGQTAEAPLAQFTQEDKLYVKQQQEKIAAKTAADQAEEAVAENYDSPWPKMVKCPENYDVEVIQEEKGAYIYETPHFRFICDAKLGKALIKKLGLLFEATHLANKTLPISNRPAHLTKVKFPAYLYEHFDTYLENGGAEGTAGIFYGSSAKGDPGRTLVPFKSLGVKTMGKTYTIDRSKDSATLIHELTHQMMSYQAKQAGWFSEGAAEYMAMTPYANGAFKFSSNRSAIIERVTAYGKKNNGGRALGTEFNAPNLEKYMNQPYSEFTSKNANLNYGLAALMVYYFYHMDGKGDAARIKAYVKALQSGTSEKEAQKILLDGRSYKELANDIEQKWRKAGVKIHFAD